MAFDPPAVPHADPDLPGHLELGACSISLNVADLERSRAFYAALGFDVVGGDPEEQYLIMKNGEATIGLFQGMFDRNILTFNPGLTSSMQRLESFLDVRAIQDAVEAAGLEVTAGVEADNPSGPASITLVDPDGNPVLIDQFF
jgi:catechol 2,3-dioxygenase-like lactoylglutathione lyase family enzyme